MEAFRPSVDQKVLSYSELGVDGDELGVNTKKRAGIPWIPVRRPHLQVYGKQDWTAHVFSFSRQSSTGLLIDFSSPCRQEDLLTFILLI
jgi:hypothetical protein